MVKRLLAAYLEANQATVGEVEDLLGQGWYLPYHLREGAPANWRLLQEQLADPLFVRHMQLTELG